MSDPIMLQMNYTPLHERISRWGPEEINRYANEMAVLCSESEIVDTIIDSEFGITPHGDTDTSRYLRGSDPAFWRRQATKRLRILQEAEQLASGVVGKHGACQYSSDVALTWKAYKDEAYAKFLSTAVLYDSLERKTIPLSEVVTGDSARLAEYYTFIKGIEGLSSGLNWAMLTITLPGAYHPSPANSSRGHEWNGVTPDASHKIISQGWARVRANLAHHKIRLSGVRTAEPMADGTPHWHCAFFYKDEDELSNICQAVLQSFPAGLRLRRSEVAEGRLAFSVEQYDSLEDYRNGDYHTNSRVGAQCQLDLGATPSEDGPNSSKVAAAFSSYILKYVSKNLEASSSGKSDDISAEDLTSIAESGPSDRVVAFRKTFGIRAINFYGLPTGARSGWSALRRIPLDDPNPLLPVPEPIRHLAQICQQPRGAGITDYLTLLGGLHSDPVPAKYRVKIVNGKGLNSYGEAVSSPVGVSVTCLDSGETYEYILKVGSKEILNSVAAEAIKEVSGFASQDPSPREWDSSSSGLVQIRTTVSQDKNQERAIRADVTKDHFVVAGAGSGKTRVIVNRVLYLLDAGVSPQDIAVTTFTREAAEALRSRLISEASKRGAALQAELFGGQGETMQVLAELVDVGTMHSLASKWLGADFKGSYDDLMSLSSLRGAKTKYLLVDESQDLTPSQWEWVDSHSKVLFSVGDFRQAIYGWRGADSSVFLSRFNTSSSAMILNTNYRSASAVVALSNAIASVAKEFEATAIREGGAVTWDESRTPEDEVFKLASWLEGIKEGSTVVLTRSNAERSFVRSRLTLLGFKHIPVMTIHSAKGLEWDNVALYCGLRKESEMSFEAREVFYVGCTRAIKSLHITSTGVLPQILREAMGLSSLIAENELYGDPVE